MKVYLLAVLILVLGQTAQAKSTTIIKIVLGDHSDDGHGKITSFYMVSNLSKKEIQIAQAIAAKKLGFNFSDEVASDYEDSAIPRDKLNTLRKNGINVQLEFEEDYKGKNFVGIGVNDYSKIWLQVVRLGNSHFNYRIISPKEELPIGGYGLF